MRTFRQFFKEQQTKKVIVFAYGRFNPPTIAHNMLIDMVANTAKNYSADFLIIPSHSVKPLDKNPLNPNQKIKILKYMTPNGKVGTFGTTYIEALQKLQEMGYTDVIQVAGSDRISEFSFLVNKYNGKPTKTGDVVFNFNSFEFVSAGERDPDSEGMSGMSASKLRNLAITGQVDGFKQGMADSVPDEIKQQTYDNIRKILKIQ